MATVSFEIPDELVAAFPCVHDNLASAIRLAAAFFWCGRGDLSTGWAAQLAGLPYASFLDAAARHKVDLFHYDNEDLAREISRPVPEDVDPQAITQDIARAQATRR